MPTGIPALKSSTLGPVDDSRFPPAAALLGGQAERIFQTASEKLAGKEILQTLSAESEFSGNLQTVSGESNQFPQQPICQTPSGKYRNHGEMIMIADDRKLDVTLGRIAHFQRQIAHLRNMETHPENYRGSMSGFLAEVDRMQLEVREYLSMHPTELERG